MPATRPRGRVRVVECRHATAGDAPWRAGSGLVSIWILGQFTPTPATTIAIPFAPGPDAARGPIVNDAYFGKVPADRLQIKDGVILLSRRRAVPQQDRPVARARDRRGRQLRRGDARADDRPVHRAADGARLRQLDVGNPEGAVSRRRVNSYNDGPLAPGQPGLGPFYELETSSPALRLAAGRALHPRPPHVPRPGQRGCARSDRARRAARGPRRSRGHVQTLRPLVHLAKLPRNSCSTSRWIVGARHDAAVLRQASGSCWPGSAPACGGCCATCRSAARGPARRSAAG